MSPLLRKTATAVAFGALVFAAPLALTSGVEAQTAQTAPGSPAGQPDDAQLQSFAAATLEVERLNEEWADRIAGAGDAEEQQAMRTQAMEQMAEAVREEGLTVPEYNAIVEVVQADPEVAETVNTYRDDMR
ncbi:MAG: DUF4168 domain-containing protein [Tistlia sp.]|uniref:DUF4168 domain-containing protein n=1 Tax=Tistlia sp. TaxID=3057121 RepID=UPI0034A2BF6F